MNLLTLRGTPYEMGRQYAEQFRTEIRHFAEDRLQLSQTKTWTGHELSRQQVLAIAEACVAEHRLYCPELMDELQGIADVTGLALAELVVLNGFTDFVDTVHRVAQNPNWQSNLIRTPSDNCTAFLVPANKMADHSAIYGQTWDMHASATPYVMLLHIHPTHAPRALIFTVVGCVGMIGMNEHGIAVGINNLMGADGQIGVMWPFVIRKVLQQNNLADALACITTAKLAGAHNYLLMDAQGNGYNVEAMSTRYELTQLESQPVVHTNHCLVERNLAVAQARPAASQKSSENRLTRAYELLTKDGLTLADLQAMTADTPTICVSETPPFHVETCGAALMRPASREFWAVQGKPSENKYQKFVV